MPVSRGQAAADGLLASYAAGALSPAMHALVASHLALNPISRSYVAALEALAADGMVADAPLSGVAERGRRLAAIFAETLPERPPVPSHGVLPSALAAYVGRPVETLKWRRVLPGLKEARLEDREGCEASLLWIKAGRAMPSHTHEGMEATLVLQGSFSDALGHYERGDMAVADSDVDHKPIAGAGEDCVCFAVSEGPVRLTGPVARLFNKLLRH